MGKHNKITPSNTLNNSKDNWMKNKNKSGGNNSSNESFFTKAQSTDKFNVSKNDKEALFSAKNNLKKTNSHNNLGKVTTGYKLDNERYSKVNKNVSEFSQKKKVFHNNKNVETKFKDGKIEKKPFNKRQWRLQKYSKKYKLEQWEEKRKKAVLREYYKEIKDDNPKMDVQKIYEEYSDESESESSEKPQNYVQKPKEPETKQHNYVHNPNYNPKNEENFESSQEIDKNSKQKSKIKAYKKAQNEFERLKQEKIAKKEDFLKKKAEREEALKLYKQKKNEKYKRLNKKTKHGQPVMKDRIEMLLEKIQSS